MMLKFSELVLGSGDCLLVWLIEVLGEDYVYEGCFICCIGINLWWVLGVFCKLLEGGCILFIVKGDDK